MEPIANFLDEDGHGERIELQQGRGKIFVTCASDWAGDTETGFGESVTQDLDFISAMELRDWLTRALNNWIEP